MTRPKVVQNAGRLIKQSTAYNGILWAQDRILTKSFAVGRRAISSANPLGMDVLLTASGGGNIGDQAMLEAFLQSTDNRVTVVTPSAQSISIPRAAIERVQVLELPSLIEGNLLNRVGDVRTFLQVLSSSKQLFIVGADIMDGLYSAPKSVARMSTIAMANALGRPATVLGFSWPEAPNNAALLAARKIREMGSFGLRDPTSYDRFASQVGGNARLVADVVFVLDGADEDQDDLIWLKEAREAGRSVALVNASALISKKFDQLHDYVELIEDLVSCGFSVLLLPHVRRPIGDDMVDCRRIAESFQTSYVRLAESPKSPLAIRALAGVADLIVTGRMHLAIIGLSRGVPAITLATQGKVEGLYRHFNFGAGVIEPRSGFSTDVIEMVADWRDRKQQIRDTILIDLDRVKAASKANFELR